MSDLLAENLSIAQSFSISKIATPQPHRFDLVSPLGEGDRTIVESVVDAGLGQA